MPESTPVCAARDGAVVAVESRYDVDGEEGASPKAGNFVLVRHPDGTLGEYAHLRRDGVKVGIGQVV